MRIKLLSDVHLEHHNSIQDIALCGSGDILILAGDILTAKHFKTNGHLKGIYNAFLDYYSKAFEHVLYVEGNHEKYGYNWEGSVNKIKENLPSNVHLMENETIKVGDWNFICFTFWTDFDKANPIKMMEAHNYMNDYKAIRIGRNYRKLNPDDTLAFNKNSREYLEEQLKTLKENVFIISHHSPSYRSVPPEFKGNFCNSAYCNDMDEFIMDNPQIKYWCHGHIHTTQDYMIEQCRVLCNPVGYPGQNTGYNPNFIMRI